MLNTKSPEKTIIRLVLGHATSRHSSGLTVVQPAKRGGLITSENTRILRMDRRAWHRFIS